MARQGLVKIELTPATRRRLEGLERALGKAEVNRRIVEFFDVRAQQIAGDIVRTRLSGGRGLRRRTGSLARSVVGRGELLGGVPAFRVGVLRGPAERYAAVQELGTRGKGGELPTIKPKRARALAIPQEGALTPSGVERFGGPRRSPVPLRFIPFRRGVAVGKLVDERQAAAEQERARAERRSVDLSAVTTYYLLVRQVDIRPKRFLRDGVRAALPGLSRDLAARIREIFAEAGRLA